jgi:phage shock protein C
MTQLDDTGRPQESPVEESPGSGLLRRSTEDKVVAGVCGGLGRYFGVDPVWFRIAFVVLAIGGGSGVLLYLIGWVAIPEQRAGEAVGRGTSTLGSQGPVIAGVALIAVGLMLLMNNLVPWFDRIMWPLVVVAAGFAMIYSGSRNARNR